MILQVMMFCSRTAPVTDQLTFLTCIHQRIFHCILNLSSRQLLPQDAHESLHSQAIRLGVQGLEDFFMIGLP